MDIQDILKMIMEKENCSIISALIIYSKMIQDIKEVA